MHSIQFGLSAALIFAGYSLAVVAAEPAANWPQWRGPLGTGAAPAANPPVEWSEEKNVRWKTALPGKGHSTPIIWNDLIFLTAAEPFGEKLEPRYSGRPGAHDNVPVTQRHRFFILAVQRKDGKTAWQKTVAEDLPREGGHYTGSLASASPVTDGTHVFAFFGSYGLFCLDFDGSIVWQKDLGRMATKHGHGEGASPALYGDTLAVNWDHEGDSFVATFNKRTGKEKWRKERDEATSWSTPIVVEVPVSDESVRNGQTGGDKTKKTRAQLIVPGTDRVRGYDLETGDVIWECGGLSANIVATPVAGEGMVFVGSSYEKRALLAIRLAGAKGDITGTRHVAWATSRGTPYVPSPLLFKGTLYYLTHYQAILTGVEAETGEDDPGAFRLPGLRNIYASPIAAADRVYVTGTDGGTLVFSPGERPKTLAVNRLHDRFSASAAAVGKELILRGEQYLYCLAEE